MSEFDTAHYLWAINRVLTRIQKNPLIKAQFNNDIERIQTCIPIENPSMVNLFEKIRGLANSSDGEIYSQVEEIFREYLHNFIRYRVVRAGRRACAIAQGLEGIEDD